MTEEQQTNPAFIVVWMTDDDTDHWIMVEDRNKAETQYAYLCKQAHVNTASICVCLKSTDYDTIKSYQT